MKEIACYECSPTVMHRVNLRPLKLAIPWLFANGHWLLALIAGYYLLWQLPFELGKLPGPFHFAIIFHLFALCTFWLTVLLSLPVSLLVIILVIRFPRRFRPKHILNCLLLSVGILVIFTPTSSYGFIPVTSLNVPEWGRSYHVGYMTFDYDGSLQLYECGPAQIFCQSIHESCHQVAPIEDIFLEWTDNKLSLGATRDYPQESKKVVYYQRSQDATLFEIPYVTNHEDQRCPIS